MKISPISFNGYKETNAVLTHHPDRRVLTALDNARPYLRQIGNAMPYPRDLVIETSTDECDTFISAYDCNKENKKVKLLARGNEHTLTEYGLDFVQQVFEGLKKNDKKDFKEIASNFVTRHEFIMWEQHPLTPFITDNDDDFDPHPACCDD